MKTITISDEVYRRLEVLKDGRSFSETISDLITSAVDARLAKVALLSRFATGRGRELSELVKEIRKRARARTLETHS